MKHPEEQIEEVVWRIYIFKVNGYKICWIEER